MTEYEYKLNNFLYPLISRINKVNILEFGVQKGRSTLKFLEICNKNGGHLFSADIDDCSDVSNDPKWTFIRSRDDNFDLIKSKIPKKVDVIFLDSLHEAAHVEKIIYNYFDLLNKDGYFFIDDVCWLPYVKNSWRTNSYAERNNFETFQTLLKIFYANYKNFDLEFTFVESGYALIRKLNNKVIELPKKIPLNRFGIKNILKNIIKKTT